MVIATAGLVAGEARTDGSVVNQLLKIAVIVVVAVLLIGVSLWVYVLIKNWPIIKAFLDAMFAFFGGGILGWFNPFKKEIDAVQTSQAVIGSTISNSPNLISAFWGSVKYALGIGRAD